jgi:bifunctional UDP-N-acetylglucosamine pyrophosphorylase/glucosamine-1-phosphate N-acetyltransferase
MTKIAGIVLAAGKGTRMLSATPKVLHHVNGQPMLSYILGALANSGVAPVVLVLGSDLTGFGPLLDNAGALRVAIQQSARGTGDAVAAAGYAFSNIEMPRYASGKLQAGTPVDATHVLISAGDTPAITADTIKAFLAHCTQVKSRLAVLGMEPPEPKGYGRLVRSESGKLQAIVEEKDATEAIRAISLCNSGVIFAEVRLLFSLLGGIEDSNAQGEYYLTDCFAAARQRGIETDIFVASNHLDFLGVNNREQLAMLEDILAERKRKHLMHAGVTMRQPATISVDHAVTVGRETVLDTGVVLRGATEVGENCRIGAHSVLRNVIVGTNAVIAPQCVLNDCIVRDGEFVAALTFRNGNK